MSFFTFDEHRGLHIVTRFETLWTALAADEHFRAFFDALADVGLHTVILSLGYHRSHGGFGVGGVADRESAHRPSYGLLHCVQRVLRHKKPCSGGAGFTAVQEGHGESDGMAWSSTASSSRIEGDFPPSSRVTRFILAAPSRVMLSPTPTKPVNEIFATSTFLSLYEIYSRTGQRGRARRSLSIVA